MSMFDRTMHPAPDEDREPDGPWWARLPEKLFRLPEDLEQHEGPVELPWQHSWHHLPKRTAGYGFTQRDYEAARRRAEEVAKSTLGDRRWAELKRNGYLELPSKNYVLKTKSAPTPGPSMDFKLKVKGYRH